MYMYVLRCFMDVLSFELQLAMINGDTVTVGPGYKEPRAVS